MYLCKRRGKDFLFRILTIFPLLLTPTANLLVNFYTAGYPPKSENAEVDRNDNMFSMLDVGSL